MAPSGRKLRTSQPSKGLEPRSRENLTAVRKPANIRQCHTTMSITGTVKASALAIGAGMIYGRPKSLSTPMVLVISAVAIVSKKKRSSTSNSDTTVTATSNHLVATTSRYRNEQFYQNLFDAAEAAAAKERGMVQVCEPGSRLRDDFRRRDGPRLFSWITSEAAGVGSFLWSRRR